MTPLLALLLAACGGGKVEDEPPIEFPPEGEYGQPCPAEERVGSFDVAALEGYSSVNGSVAEDILPITVHEEVGREGDCALFKKENPFCDPACVAGQLCEDTDGNPATNGECAPYPPNLDAGTVHVRGTVEAISVEPDGALNYSETSLPYPPFEQGPRIQLFAEGAETEPFSLDGAGVALIESGGTWTVSPDMPLDVTWTPSDGPGRIWITLNVDQHGNSPVTLICDVEDTGTTTIPATLINQLIDSGVSGAANGFIRRRTVDSVQIAQGCVELLVYSQFHNPLDCVDCPTTF